MIVELDRWRTCKTSYQPLTRSQPRQWAQLLLACLTVCFFVNGNLIAAVDQNLADPQVVPVQEELTEADQLAFAAALEQAAIDGDSDAWHNLVDWERLIETVMSGDTSPSLEKARATFKAGFLETLGKPTKDRLAEQIISYCEDGGSFKFLRLGRVDNQPIAVFRILLPNEGGVNYHQYFLKRSEDGQVRAEDIYVFLTAERMSDTLRVFWRTVVAEASKTFLDRLFKPADPLAQSIRSISEMRAMIKDGQFEKAIEIYDKLPEKVQNEKIINLTRMQAAIQVSDDAYASSIEDYRQRFPGDAALDFLLIDGYFFKKDYEKMLDCIDRTSEHVGGDAWLLSMRAQTLAHLERFEQARDVAQEAIRLEPELQDVYWRAITVSLMGKDFDETVKLLNMVEQDLGLELADLTELHDYAEFVESPQYEAWMKSRE